MAAAPREILRRERVVIIVTAVVVVALLGGVVWALGRGPSTAGEAAASPSAAASPALAASIDQAVEPSASAQPDAGDASPAPTDKTATPTPTPTPTPKARASQSGQATASASDTPTPKATTTRKATPKPTATKTTSSSSTSTAAHFVVTGKVAKKTTFTVKQLKKMDTFSGKYFSRGKEPPEATTSFVGVRLIDILNKAKLKSDAKSVTITAADDYTASFSIAQVKASYIDETRPNVKLPMIIAYSEDGKAYTGSHPFRLVLGQTVEGDYNRQYWVRIVVTITVE